MRRALLLELPAFAAVFHIRPWEIDLLTEIELSVFRVHLKKLEEGQ